MRTSKAVSTISYNSIEFLERRLKELTEKHIISNYMFIKHYAEKDETKNHIHLYMQPNKLIDTMDLQDYFIELDFNNPNKPLKCIDFRLSSIDDWILYSMHYKPYLLSKMEVREFSYNREDFYYYDVDMFERDYLHAFKGSNFAHSQQILDVLFDSNNNPLDLIGCGAVPLNLAPSLVALQNLKKYGYRKENENYEERH